jgi:predicted secreted hydrolase
MKYRRMIEVILLLFFLPAACGPLKLGAEDRLGLDVSLPLQNPGNWIADTEGYERAEGDRIFNFPADHGPHADYQTEWWYYTGTLETEDGRGFGYQLTFFRRALQPPDDRQDRSSPWAVEQIYMAHFTITNIQEEDFRFYERLERGAADLAGAEADPFYQVWLGDWSVEQLDSTTYHLLASADGLRLDLVLDDQKGVVLQGDNGYSRKGDLPGNASYYYSLTDMHTQGTLDWLGEEFIVQGKSWMDHEFSTSALAPEQIGWDWFALHLSDGSELMVYTVRRKDGSIDPLSTGTMIDPEGNIQSLQRQDFEIDVLTTWRSPHSGGVYPAEWAVRVPSENLYLEVTPVIPDQELMLSFVYWEGAVRVVGEHQGASLKGNGYVELTGYAHSMQGQF